MAFILLRSSLAVAFLLLAAFTTTTQAQKPNVLFLMTDQQRFDAIQRVQEELASYNGKVKIRTPNLDRLSRGGAYFRTAYTQCPVCAPARTVLRTGTTVERCGVQTNLMSDAQNALNPTLFQDKIDKLEGLDQILTEHGYVSEYYGKWHIPERLYYSKTGDKLAVQANDYDYLNDIFTFDNNSWGRKLRGYLQYFHLMGDIQEFYEHEQQQDTYSHYPYTPIRLDSRFGFPTHTGIEGFDSFGYSQNSQMGNYTMAKEYSASFLNHDVALRALDRLAVQADPFILTVSYHHPHPPYMAPSEYLDYYWENKDNLFTSPNNHIPLDEKNPYFARKEQDRLKDNGYCEADKIQEWTAVYYALVEEIDTLVGIMLDRVEELGIADNTMVVFTSDHGEMLGAHCMRSKSNFFEESARVPLFIKYPKSIPAQTIVEEPVSLIDIFSTILDYAGASESDNSDGSTLRKFIEHTSKNEFYDEAVAVSEWDYREPLNSVGKLSRSLDNKPNFLIRHGDYKLFIHKQADSNSDDMLINIVDDPFEMNNLIGSGGPAPNATIIGKAEHLRCLLLDWVGRVDINSEGQYYSNPIYNGGEGQGDMIELFNRQAWPSSDIWVGDSVLEFKKTAVRDLGTAGFVHTCSEWLFIGRRNVGTVILNQLNIVGSDAHLFHLADQGQTTISTKGVLRVKVTFASTMSPYLLPDIDATIVVAHTAGDPIYVPIVLNVPAYRVEEPAPQERAQQTPPLSLNSQEGSDSKSTAPAMFASTWGFGILSLLILLA
jgi:arylsulfatase A-like enzyme